MTNYAPITRIVFVLVDNRYIETPYWQLFWIDKNGNTVQMDDFERFKEAHTEASRTLRYNPDVKMYVKTKDDEHPLDNDTQLVMDLLTYG